MLATRKLISEWRALIKLRREDLNLQPPGYEPGGLPNCPTPRHVREEDSVKVFSSSLKLSTVATMFCSYCILTDIIGVVKYSSPIMCYKNFERAPTTFSLR